MLVTPITEMVWAFVFIFIYCEFGERVNYGFTEVYDTICHFDWYSLPMEIQKMLPTIIIASQEPINLHGFGDVKCSRITSKIVN